MGIDLKELENLQSSEKVPIDFENLETNMPTSVDKVVSSNVSLVKNTGREIINVPKQIISRFDSLKQFYNTVTGWGKNNVFAKGWNYLFGKKKKP